MNTTFILASASPRRKDLLAQVGISFQVETSGAQEKTEKKKPKEIVKALSRQKAREVWRRLEKKYQNPVVIGADTVVSVDGRILGKPRDDREAFWMLSLLAGRRHQVYTGVTVISRKGEETFSAKTHVEIYDMSDNDIRAYIATGEPLDKAGAYGIQGAFAAHVKGIEGDYNNVVGLPVGKLCRLLRKRGLDWRLE